MRKLLCLTFLFLSALGFSQTATVTGHTVMGTGATSTSGISILFELTNDNGQQCKVGGIGLITPMSFTVTPAQLAAGISIYQNSSITCGTTTGATRWRYTLKSNDSGTRTCSINITGATNLDTTPCLNAIATPTTTVPTASLYWLLDGSNFPTGNFIPAANGTQALGSSALRWNMFANTANITNLTVTGTCTGCGSGGGTGTVTSFSSGNLSPLFTTSVATATTTPAQTFALSNAAAHTFLGNTSGISAVPSYSTITAADLPGVFAQTLANVSHKWLNSYDAATGLFTQTQPAYSDLTGTPQLAITKTAVTSNWLRSYDSTTGLFTASQPAYTDITGTPQLPVTKTAVASNWIRSYDSTTGLFTASQPACADLSNGAASCSTDTTNAANITSGTLPSARMPAYTGDVASPVNTTVNTLATTIPNAHTFSGAFIADSAKSIGSVLYASQFAGSSTTCGIAEAYAALPAGGGKIILQQGNCSAAGWPVTISKPVVIEGQGMGGPNDAGFNVNVIAGSSLTNTSTGGSFFIITIPGTVGISAEGMTFRDFAMIGNKQVGGATAGDCVDMKGGTSTEQIRAIRFDNIQCNQPKGFGFLIQDNAFIITFVNTHVDQSGSHCFVIQDGPNAGVVSQIHIIASVFDLCGGSNASFAPGTADGIHISGVNNRSVEITDSTMADSNNGIFVVAGAVNASVHVTNSDFETNTTCDISLNDGLDHRITSSTLFGTGTGARGVCTAMPAGAATQNLQLFMDGNWLGSHTVQDVTIGANQKTCFLLPQMANNYTYTDNSGHCVRMDVNQFGILNFTAVEVEPAANGTTALGDSAAAWSNVFTFVNSLTEGAAPAAVGGKDVCYGDSTIHQSKCSYNGGPFAPVRNGDVQADIVADSGALNTTETIIVKTPALAANRLIAGTHIRVTLTGTCTSTVANTNTFTIRMGTLGTTSDTAIATPVTGVAATTGTNIPFKAVIDFTVRTIGASGTGFITLELENQGTTGISATATQLIMPTMSTFNTTTASNILSVSYKSAATTTTSTFKQGLIEIVHN